MAAMVINNVQRPEARPRGNVPPPPLIFAGPDITPIPDASNSVKVKLYHDPKNLEAGKYETHAFFFKPGLPSSGVTGYYSCVALLVAKPWPVDRHGTVWHEICSRINICEISMPSPSSSAQKR